MRNQLDFEKPIAELQTKLEEWKKHPEAHSLDISFEEEVAIIEKKLEETKRQIFSNLSAWDRIKIARHPKRPFTLDYLQASFTGFTELHGDRVLILENAYYSVISPEGCAAILWKDRSAAANAAEALRITAKHLLELGLVDEIVPEPLGGAHTHPELMAATLRDYLVRHLESLVKLPAADRLKQRYAKFRAYGHFAEKQPPT